MLKNEDNLTKKTIGQIQKELSEKGDDGMLLEDLSAMAMPSFIENFNLAVERGKKENKRDFYIEVRYIRDNHLKRHTHFYFPRLSCPTPIYSQMLYKYIRIKNNVELIWLVPSKRQCKYYTSYRLDLTPDEKCLADFAEKFYNKTLYKMAKAFNNEKNNNILIINKDIHGI